MLDHLLKLYLKLSRKTRLLPFIEGLANLGRPSAVLFPMELLEQGAGLLLSGLNNTLAIQSNLDWVWPHWLERQQDPLDREFVPTGVNLMTANLSMRNWTSLGVVDSCHESMLDPVGMLTLFPFGWSVFPYVRLQGGDHFPPRFARGAVNQQLKNGVLPVVITEYYGVEHLAWWSQTRAVRVNQEELVAYEHLLENRGDTELTLTFGLSLRPYNSLTIGHINKLKFKNRLWRVNGRPGLLLAEEPARVAVSDRASGDPLLAREWPLFASQGVSKSGIMAGVAEYDVVLAPGERRRILSYGTLAKGSQRINTKFADITTDRVDAVIALDEQAWQHQAQTGLQVTLPDKVLQTAFTAVKNHLHVFDDQTFFAPGTFFYHEHWFRDSAFIARAFHDVGFADRVRPKMADYMARQTKDGFFRSQNGEWDSTGQAMVTMVDHVRRTGDRALLADMYSALHRGARWLENTCRKSQHAQTDHYGLLPAGFSAEHFGPNDHYFWDNFWGLAGMKRVVWAARMLGRERDANRWHDAQAYYEQCIREAMSRAMQRDPGRGLPCSPYRRLDSAAIGNLIAITPLDLVSPHEPWVAATVAFLMENNLTHGLFFQKIIHTGMNAYLSVQLAKTLLAMDDPRWETMLQSLLTAATPTYTWPEAINPKTGGGCMGDGDHGWAAAEFLCLIRDMLVREQQGELHLGAGIPMSWFRPGLDLVVRGADSPYGSLDYHLQQDEQGLQITWQRRLHELHPPADLFLLVPHGIQPMGLPSQAHGPNRHKIPLHAPTGTIQLTVDTTLCPPRWDGVPFSFGPRND